ncbi:hypothetical protein KUCAC02_005179 [Chaenocephalus aceratus]|uniref:Uncharacterized protein n=1 Tax=Chaenocephalus aceratus TaxID=36190 RepID=A0ACB9WP79_CHAAC|nr:hypothetical protein KUCAC02_005179 [Chaenocephalus aceratus]
MVKVLGKPKGKMSSYAYFVQTCREEHKKKHPEASVNFSEFSKKCSERWKPARGRSDSRTPMPPKRPPSAFFLFCGDFRAKIKSEHPGLTIGDTAKKLGEMWNTSSAENKQPYERKGAKLKEKYDKEDDGENLFLLSPFSGEFLLSRSLDFEAQRFYILTVVVQQGDSKVSSVRVYFNVLDVNANPPVFSQDTFSALLLEDTLVGTCFLALIVSDKVDGDNGALKLTVAGGADEGMFFINRAGSLCLKTELDRERQPFYNLTVTANDCVQPASLQFTTTANVIGGGW